MNRGPEWVALPRGGPPADGVAERGVWRIGEGVMKIVGIGKKQHIKSPTLEGASDMLPKLRPRVIESYQRPRQSPCTDHVMRRIMPQYVGKLHFLNHAVTSAPS